MNSRVSRQMIYMLNLWNLVRLCPFQRVSRGQRCLETLFCVWIDSEPVRVRGVSSPDSVRGDKRKGREDCGCLQADEQRDGEQVKAISPHVASPALIFTSRQCSAEQGDFLQFWLAESTDKGWRWEWNSLNPFLSGKCQLTWFGPY